MSKPLKRVQAWAALHDRIRSFFASENYLEVFTPALVEAGAFEHSLDALKVSGNNASGELNTSPEIRMKLLMSEIQTSVYQVCKSYRDDPTTQVHLQEFTMLEYYKIGADVWDILETTKKLFEKVVGQKLEFSQFTMNEIFKDKLGIPLSDVLTLESLTAFCKSKQLATLDTKDSWEDLFFKIWLSHIESKFDPDVPIVITDFPSQLSALGHVGKTGWTERFEIYWKGMEICNGCRELNNVQVLDARYKVESEFRESVGKKPHPYPNDLKKAFENNFPDCSGVAVGLDRLFWATYKDM